MSVTQMTVHHTAVSISAAAAAGGIALPVADLVGLPWQQLAVAVAIALAGGAVAFITNMAPVVAEPEAARRRLAGDLASGCFVGAIMYAVAAEYSLTIWPTFVLVAVGGTSGRLGIYLAQGWFRWVARWLIRRQKGGLDDD